MADYAEDRIVPHSHGFLYKVQTRLLDDNEPDAWHTLDAFLTLDWAKRLIASRAAIRERFQQ